MPRLFYKVIVALAFVVIGISLLAAEVWAISWLLDRYPSPLAWIGFASLVVIDAGFAVVLGEAAIRNVKRA